MEKGRRHENARHLVTMNGYTYGGTVSTPGVGTYSGEGAVTYYYNTTDSASGGTVWENITATTLNANTYEELMNTTVVDEVGSTQVITSEMDEAAFLRSQIVEIRRRKDGLYAERAEHANTEVQIRLLLELVDEMVKNSLPEWMAREAETVEETGACRDYDDFFSRTKYTVPEGVLDENGRMEAFNNDLVIRYLDRVVVKDDGYEVVFKAGVTVEVEI